MLSSDSIEPVDSLTYSALDCMPSCQYYSPNCHRRTKTRSRAFHYRDGFYRTNDLRAVSMGCDAVVDDVNVDAVVPLCLFVVFITVLCVLFYFTLIYCSVERKHNCLSHQKRIAIDSQIVELYKKMHIKICMTKGVWRYLNQVLKMLNVVCVCPCPSCASTTAL